MTAPRAPTGPPEGDLRPSDLLPAFLRAEAVAHADDEAAFVAFSRALTRQLGLLGAVAITVATVAWWPLDAWVLPPGPTADGFARMRLHAIAVELVSLLVFYRASPRAPWIVPAAMGLYAAVLLAFGEGLGAIAAPSAQPSTTLWLADAWLGVVPMACLPMPIRWRIPAVAASASALPAGFFLLHPANLALPGALAQLSFGGFAVAFTVVLGEAVWQLLRRMVFERRALDRARGDLERLTATLSEQVAERTSSLQALARHLEGAQESERRRLAHDLHDDLGQQLTAMRYTLARLESRAATGGDVGPLVQDLEALLAGTTRATRGVVTRLRPRVLDDLGLIAALEWLCEDAQQRTDVPCRLSIDGDAATVDALTADAALALFRTAQEASTNALRHAAPSCLSVEVRATADGVALSVVDDGVGFDPTAVQTGFGLLGLRERLAALGGAVSVTSAPGHGTRVAAHLPLGGVP
ncbi:MAG: sensor histidine kinase [Alphaproteobacteria bacterium]|nr:sensor histidine kinase [Alphaproteobacteria bacterium]